MSSIDKHAPLKHKRIGKKKSPWITSDLLQKMHKRDYVKKKAVQTNDQNYWRQYKVAQNETNNAIKTQKRKYFTTNLDANKNDPCKAWKLMNELIRGKKYQLTLLKLRLVTNLLVPPRTSLKL